MNHIHRHTDALLKIFAAAGCKHEAHYLARPILQDMIHDRAFLTEAAQRHLNTPGALNLLNFPSIAFDCGLNQHFGLVLNCWAPRPDQKADVSATAIHHHGNMLLSTATLLGPGYGHWLFSRAQLVDPSEDLFALRLIETTPHPAGHIEFIDAFTPHVTWFPTKLSITLCLWSNQDPTTWRDQLKRITFLKAHEQGLKEWSKRLGIDRRLAKAFDLKLINFFDFYPVENGFRGMRVRDKYKHGPNEDYLRTLFHIFQVAGLDDLVPILRCHLSANSVITNRPLAAKLLGDLEAGRPIEPQLSACHLHSVDPTSFTCAAVKRAQDALDRAGKLA